MLVVAMVSLTSLLALAGITALSVKSGLSAAAHDRFQSMALLAAESGVAAGMDFLRTHIDPSANWSALVSPDNTAPQSPTGIPGNGVEPGQTGHLLSAEANSWYEVTVFNNVGDPDFATGGDADGRVIVRSVGHGPGGATVVLELEVAADGITSVGGRPCPGYAQRGIAEDSAGRNDCLNIIDATDISAFRPSGS